MTDITTRTEVLSGMWRNQLGSTLALRTDGRGRLAGQFRSAAGDVVGVALPVVGTYDPSPSDQVTVLAFVVDWTAVHAVTAWSGHYLPEEGVIRATWILTAHTAPGDEWHATTIGQDVFHREPATTTEPE